MSGDVRYLACASAIDKASKYMTPKEAEQIALKFMRSREPNIMDSMF